MRAKMSALIKVCIALLLLQEVACEDDAANATDLGNRTAAASATSWLQVVYVESVFPSEAGNGSVVHCAGTLIGSTAVLTAASCVYDAQTKAYATNVTVRYGSESTSEGGQVQTSSQYRLRDEDKPTGLALIKLNGSSPSELHVSAEGEVMPVGAEVSTAGWALSSDAPLAQLKSAPMTVAGIDSCQSCASNGSSDGLICASYVDAASCAGDVGSPLVHTDHQVGVLVLSCTPCAGRAVYADLGKVHQWIESQLDADADVTTEAPKPDKEKNAADVAGLSWALFCALCLAAFSGAK